VVKSLDDFNKGCEIILANRLSLEIIDVRDKIYTRDIFGRD
jgi:UDPglucose 6-dehydrogenase